MKLRNIYRVRAFNSAFTLIELIMIISILAIVAVVCIISINSYKVQHLHAAAEQIANDLRYTKNLAISSTRWHGIIFNVNPTNTYSVYQTDGTTDTTIKDLQDPGRDFIVQLNVLYPGVQISAVNIASGNKVEFDPYGTPYNDKNGAALASNGTITLSSGTTTAVISIEAQTGKIGVQ
jgi:Tfp pilus assembly protein FimT